MKFDSNKEMKLNITNVAYYDITYIITDSSKLLKISLFVFIMVKHKMVHFYKIAYVYLALRHLHDICFKTNELQISTKEKE